MRTSNDYLISISLEKGSVIVKGVKITKLQKDSRDTFEFDKTKVTITHNSIAIAAGAGKVIYADNKEGFDPKIEYLIKDISGKVIVDINALTPSTPHKLYVRYWTNVVDKSTGKMSVQQKEDFVMEFKTKEAPVNPVTPTTPNCTRDDTANTVNCGSLDPTTLEVSLNAGTTYLAFDPAATYAGDKTLLIRVKAQGINPASAPQTLNFTTNPDIDTTPPALQSAFIQGGELIIGSPII